MIEDTEKEKHVAALAAAALVEPGSTVGLGTGSTVARLLPALAERQLDLRCVATSPATEDQARALGLRVDPFEGIARLDIAIDGADQVAPDGWLVKGGGGAHTREKVVAAAAERFVVIVSSDKVVEAITPPVPVELLRFGVDATLRSLPGLRLRPGSGPSPDGGLIGDWDGDTGDPAAVAAMLDAVPGVVAHGLFPPALVTDILVARRDEVEHRQLRR